MKFIIESLVAVFAVWFCSAMLVGVYLLAYAAAPYLHMADHRDAFGVLTAIALVWVYEHQRLEDRRDRG